MSSASAASVGSALLFCEGSRLVGRSSDMFEQLSLPGPVIRGNHDGLAEMQVQSRKWKRNLVVVPPFAKRDRVAEPRPGGHNDIPAFSGNVNDAGFRNTRRPERTVHRYGPVMAFLQISDESEHPPGALLWPVP